MLLISTRLDPSQTSRVSDSRPTGTGDRSITVCIAVIALEAEDIVEKGVIAAHNSNRETRVGFKEWLSVDVFFVLFGNFRQFWSWWSGVGWPIPVKSCWLRCS